MRRSLLLLLTLATALVVTACTADPGPPGPRGEQGPAGADGQPATSDVDAIVQRLADDPAFRQALVEALARDHAEELRGPTGEQGPAGAQGEAGSGVETVPTCYPACTVDADCFGGGNGRYTCSDGQCIDNGCGSDAECPQNYVCR